MRGLQHIYSFSHLLLPRRLLSFSLASEPTPFPPELFPHFRLSLPPHQPSASICLSVTCNMRCLQTAHKHRAAPPSFRAVLSGADGFRADWAVLWPTASHAQRRRWCLLYGVSWKCGCPQACQSTNWQLIEKSGSSRVTPILITPAC